MKKAVIYMTTIIFSIMYIVLGNKIASSLDRKQQLQEDQQFIKARVTKIVSEIESNDNLGGVDMTGGKIIIIEAEVLSGEDKGKTIIGKQTHQSFSPVHQADVAKGDKVVLIKTSAEDSVIEWEMVDFVRSDNLIILGIIFVLFIILFGRLKGISTIISLVFTCLAVFVVFIPSILSGQNIYFWSLLTCAFVIVMTLLIVNGANSKALAAGIGCVGGIVVSSVLTLIMGVILKLTGVVDEESIFLLNLHEEIKIDIRAIIFGAIVIGAIGAIMDVAVDISSALNEIAVKVKKPTFSELFGSGMRIGRDILGTMANTLILAYIGSSLSVVILLMAYNNSLLYIFNREMIVVEVLQALVGSFGILATIPFTSLACAFFFSRRHEKAVISIQ